MRKPFQGTLNIVRFNWEFYVVALITVSGGLVLLKYLPQQLLVPAIIVIAGITLSILTSLFVAWYIYDHSGLYNLSFLDNPSLSLPALFNGQEGTILNMHAGFDETSAIIKQKFPSANLVVMDFYDPAKHTERSVRRARKAYAPYPGTIRVTTTDWFRRTAKIDLLTLIFAAHEIRDEQQRISFFFNAAGQLNDNGRIVLTEHVRDLNNLIAFSIGFLHFYSTSTWLKTFRAAGLEPEQVIRNNAWIKTYILRKIC